MAHGRAVAPRGEAPVAVTVQVKKFGPPTSVSVDAVAIELTGKKPS